MTLQVRLPLNKNNLNNKGVANVIITNVGAAFDSTNGKFGGCHYFNKKYLKFPIPFTSTTAISTAFWIKIPATVSGNCQVTNIGTSSGWANIRFGVLIKTGTSQLVFHISDGTNTLTYTVASDALPLNTWTHVVCTYQNKVMKIYLNGVENKSYTASYTPSFSGISEVGVGAAPNGAESCIIYLNDYRLYDHCLSLEEVKELAKGLFLHYPLNRGGWGQENNIAASKIVNRGCNNFSYDALTNTWSMSAPVNTSAWGVGFYINDTSIKWKSGESWVVSMEVYVPKALTWNNDINNKPDLSDISSYTGNDYDDQRFCCTNGVMGSRSLKSGWNKIWFTQRAPSTYGLYNYATNFGVITSSESAAIDIKIKNIKGEIVEKGLTVKPTPWCPNSADALATTVGLNSLIEYDISGFNNNGARTGAFTWSSDTLKYGVSTKITPNGNIQFTPMLAGANSWTIAAWIKPTIANNDNKVWFSIEQDTYWQVTCYSNQLGIRDNSIGSTGTRKNYSFGTVAANTWVHLVATYDKGTLKLYNNGVLQNTNTVGGTYLNAMNNGRWGSAVQSGFYWDGQISDARIYATALSDDDIKKLYQMGH